MAEEGDVGIPYKMVLVKLEDGQMALLISNQKMDQKKVMLRVGTRYFYSELVILRIIMNIYWHENRKT